MSELDLFAGLRPDDVTFDADAKARIRAELFGDAVASPSLLSPLREVLKISAAGSDGPRPRGRSMLIVAAAVMVLVGGLTVVASRRDVQVTSNDAPLITTTLDTAVVTSPSVAATAEPATSTTEPSVVGDSVLPPGVVLPAQLPVLGQEPAGEAPVRTDPVERWLHPENVAADPAWFVRHDVGGAPIGGVRVQTANLFEFSKSFAAAPAANVPGADARIIGHSIAWTTDSATHIVDGFGDVTIDELTQIAAAIVPQEPGPFETPPGFDRVGQPVHLDSTLYAAAGIEISLYRDADEAPADLQDFTFMSAGSTGTIVANGSGYTVQSQESSLVVERLAGGQLITLFAPPDADVAALIASITFAPTTSIGVRTIGYQNQIPADATWRFGEISLGRWAAATFVDTKGQQCRYVRTASVGTGSCGSTDLECPLIAQGGSAGEPDEFVVMIDREVSEVQVVIDGETEPATVEKSNGYTFAFGTTTRVPLHVSFVVDGEPECGYG